MMPTNNSRLINRLVDNTLIQDVFSHLSYPYLTFQFSQYCCLVFISIMVLLYIGFNCLLPIAFSHLLASTVLLVIVFNFLSVKIFYFLSILTILLAIIFSFLSATITNIRSFCLNQTISQDFLVTSKICYIIQLALGYLNLFFCIKQVRSFITLYKFTFKPRCLKPRLYSFIYYYYYHYIN